MRGELLFQDFGVSGADPEDDHGADVAEDGGRDILVHLLYVLVGNGQIELVFAGLGQDVRERGIGEVLEFVHE